MHYIETALREELSKSPWEELREQAILGSTNFLRQLQIHLKGDGCEKNASRRLAAARAEFEQIIERIEGIKKEKWNEFRDRHNDSGRDVALWAGRRLCGLKWKELANLTQMNDSTSAAWP